VENGFITLMRGLAAETRVHAGDVAAVLEAATRAGYAESLSDIMFELKLKLREQEEREHRMRAAALGVQGRQHSGWFDRLQQVLENDVDGMWAPIYSPLHGGGGVYAFERFLDTLIPVGRGLQRRNRRVVGTDTLRVQRVGEEVLALAIPTICTNYYSEVVVSCASDAHEDEHVLILRFGKGGLRLQDAVLQPADVPLADLMSDARKTGDVPGLISGVRQRIAAYAKRWENFAQLEARFAAWWQPSSPLLHIQAANNMSTVVHLDHSFPWPTPPSSLHVTISVIRADGIVFHQTEALKSLSQEMTLFSQGNFSSRLDFLEERLAHYRSRCINDCSGHGFCNYAVHPPVCECHEGYRNDDCSHVSCPNDCNNRGACDSRQLCSHNDETGEDHCVGGTGKCSCLNPYYGADCSLQPCQRTYIVLDGINASLGAAHFRDMYEDRGLAVANVQLRADDGSAPPLGSIAGDVYYSSGEMEGVGYILFERSEDATLAFNELYSDAIPSRGIAQLARQFPQELRAFEKRERLILSLFGVDRVECGGRGACDFHVGQCYCDQAFFGTACEYTYCPSDCSGHGVCDFVTGTCACEEFYVQDIFLGCKFRSLALASTTCQDEALNSALDAVGSRVSPVYLSCMLGVQLGSQTAQDYCPDADLLAGPKDFSECYTAVNLGSVCADCSGYTLQNVSQLHLYREEPCITDTEYREENCIFSRSSTDPVRGLGMLPEGQVTFNLAALRAKEVVFTAFKARPGIVRRYGGTMEEGGCGACTDDSPQCGAYFEVQLDGAPVWSSVVATDTAFELDVRGADTLTLYTSAYTPTYWRNGMGRSYGGGPAPALATQPTRAIWCDGAGWADARLT